MQHPKPPVVAQKPKTLTTHGHERIDPYYWLREKDNSAVTDYLKAENEYTKVVMADTKDTQKQLYEEMKGRIKETDQSVPIKDGDYYYYRRTQEGLDYPIYCRKAGSLDSEEEIILDQNQIAKGLEHCSLGVFQVSPDHKLLAYSLDTDGSERYTVYVKDLSSGELLKDELKDTHYSLEWMNDSRTFIYSTIDHAYRPFKALVHTLGTEQDQDKEIYEEIDERFYLDIDKSKDEKYIFLGLESKVTTEVHFFEADDLGFRMQVISPRQQDHEYAVEHHEGSFIIMTNDRSKNFRIVRAPVSSPAQENWQVLVPGDESVLISGIDVFKDFLSIHELTAAVASIRIHDFESGEEHRVEFEEEAYVARDYDNPEYDTDSLHVAYSSMVTPHSIYRYDVGARKLTLLKQEELIGGYDRGAYVTERISATAEDGTEVPISLVYKQGLKRDGNNPCLLYGYGSYGAPTLPTFSEFRLTLLDRGFVFAMAHIRGGGENGRQWYENGKYLHKKNTFTDFIACAEHLVEEQYTRPTKLAIYGGSAGGLLVGAVVNMRPDLFQAVVAKVPFVDIVTTILDDKLPLSILEYEEWGNPNEKKYYEYMLSYSPYDNVSPQDYPHMLVTAGLNDPRVSYWEPAKWVAKLRELKTDDNILLLKTEMNHGHGGATGRYKFLEELAFEDAFLLEVLGVED